MRYFIEITYKGTHYHGWQRQENALTVQEVLENALQTYLRTPVGVVGSGRTDTGVHALQQIAHFDIPTPLNAQETCYKLNRILPQDIVVKNLQAVAQNQHARFDALYRKYRYQLSPEKLPFYQGFYYESRKKYDFDLMNIAAEKLLSYQDFECFSKTHSSTKHFLCKIQSARWEYEPPFYCFHIQANRFLRGMVRMIVGTLLTVGIGQLSIEGFERILQEGKTEKPIHLAPAQGLFLQEVAYDFYPTPIS